MRLRIWIYNFTVFLLLAQVIYFSLEFLYLTYLLNAWMSFIIIIQCKWLWECLWM